MGEIQESALLQRLPAEMRLVVACCAWPAGNAEIERTRRCLEAPIDWEHLQRVVRRQRVSGLVYAHLKGFADCVPVSVMEMLRADARRQMMESLARATEAQRMVAQLRSVGIRVAVLKGAPLAILAYGDLALRQSRDNDLLVRPEDALAAARVIEAAGYVRKVPDTGWGSEHLQAWVQISKHFEYQHAHTGAALDLHWRAVDNPYLAEGRFGLDALQEVAITPQLALPTLASDALLLYLCVHGAMHSWFRLKWLADVAALLRHGGPEGMQRLLAEAESAGLQRPVHLALTLSHALFATGVPEGVHCDHATHLLLRASIDALSAGRGATGIYSRSFGTTRLRAAVYLLRSDRRYRLRQLQNDLTAAHQAPPRSSGWMRVVPRAAEWMWRRIKTR